MISQNVFDFIKAEEIAYKTLKVSPIEGWDWNMYDHIKFSSLYKNSTFSDGKRGDKPFKNITRPLLNLQYRAEGFDVKDIVLYVNDAYEYYKSLLVRKFHDTWARENSIDTFIDEMVESYVDFGGTLVKDVNDVRPEVVPLQRLAFCDQTDILSGPICEKHLYSPDQLKEMESQGWDNIDDVILLAEAQKKSQQGNMRDAKVPGKYIEVYELHGSLPAWWLEDDAYAPTDEPKYIRQLHIVAFYETSDVRKNGIALFKGKEKESAYKFLARDPIYGRALGLGGAEELFEPQVWTNYDIIRIKGMLDQAAKVLYQTTDTAFAARNRTSNLENGEILVTQPNTVLQQINTSAPNIVLFEKSVAEWEQHAQQMAGASDALLGEPPSSGTPFALQNLVVNQGQMLHDYRRGKLAVFMDEIYRDWVMPYIAREIAKGQEFLSELDLEELQQVADSLVTCQANDLIKEKILNGETIDPQEIELMKQQVRDDFMKGGNQRFMQILQGELKSVPLDVKVNIKGKQKDLAGVVDKLSNVFKTVIAAPQVLQDPTMAKLLNQIMEASGLEPLDFTSVKPPMMQPQPNKPPVQAALPQPANAGAY